MRPLSELYDPCCNQEFLPSGQGSRSPPANRRTLSRLFDSVGRLAQKRFVVRGGAPEEDAVKYTRNPRFDLHLLLLFAFTRCDPIRTQHTLAGLWRWAVLAGAQVNDGLLRASMPARSSASTDCQSLLHGLLSVFRVSLDFDVNLEHSTSGSRNPFTMRRRRARRGKGEMGHAGKPDARTQLPAVLSGPGPVGVRIERDRPDTWWGPLQQEPDRGLSRGALECRYFWRPACVQLGTIADDHRSRSVFVLCRSTHCRRQLQHSRRRRHHGSPSVVRANCSRRAVCWCSFGPHRAATSASLIRLQTHTVGAKAETAAMAAVS